MGHGTIVTSKEGNDYYLYHAYNKTDDVYTGRQGMLGNVAWNAQTGWPFIQPQGKKVGIKKNFRDDFSGDTLSYAWQWDFRNSKPNWKIEKGNLYLSGKTDENNITGSVVTVRPITGHYEMTTRVVNHNASLKGLVLYGDAGQAVGIGVQNNEIEVWEVKNQKRLILKEETIAGNKFLYLKMRVEKGYQCRFFWSDDRIGWKELKTGGDYLNADFLPPWDRSPRPGLIHQGVITVPAVFSFFEITYQ
jgi:beta-xylosidase